MREKSNGAATIWHSTLFFGGQFDTKRCFFCHCFLPGCASRRACGWRMRRIASAKQQPRHGTLLARTMKKTLLPCVFATCVGLFGKATEREELVVVVVSEGKCCQGRQNERSRSSVHDRRWKELGMCQRKKRQCVCVCA